MQPTDLEALRVAAAVERETTQGAAFVAREAGNG